MKPQSTLSATTTDSGRDKLITGARRHFLTHGFRRVTMDDLARELGMSKRTFYTLFRSKRDLLEAVLDDKLREIETDLQRITAHPVEQVAQTLADLVACLQRHVQELHPAFIRDMRREAPELFDAVSRRRAMLVQRHFGQVLKSGQRVGVIRRDISAAAMIQVLLGAIGNLLTPAMLAECDLSLQEGFNAVISVFMEGVAAPTHRSRK